MKSIIERINSEELNRNESIRSRGLLSKKWAAKSPDEISSIVSYMTLDEHKAFVQEILVGGASC